jgi:hypothetical protein
MSRTALLAVGGWSLGLALTWLLFGGGRLAPCLGFGSALDACISAWKAANPPPPALVDPALPWLWLGLYVVGLAVLYIVFRGRGSTVRAADVAAP